MRSIRVPRKSPAGNANRWKAKEMYRVILADPPWKADEKFSMSAGYARNHYSYMTIDEICAMPIKQIAADDSILLLWTTWVQLQNAFKVISSWGFEYVTGFPWVKLNDHPAVDMFGNFIAKPVYGTGQWVRGCSEPILIGKRGNIPMPKTHWLGLLSKRLQHSRKPDDIYQYAETFPAPYLELFARRKRSGWDVFGNQVEGSIRLPTPLALDGAIAPDNQQVLPADVLVDEGTLPEPSRQ